MFSLKHLMHTAMPFPKNDFASFYGSVCVSPHFQLVRVPNRHLVVGNPHLQTGISSKMLIRKEQHATCSLKCPFKDGRCIAGSANNSIMFTNKCFQTRSRINVRHRCNVISIDDFAEICPTVFNLFYTCHVCHRTTSSHIRQSN